ncbi:hypothetical protein Dimus_028089 [Dionaea muscipula]
MRGSSLERRKPTTMMVAIVADDDDGRELEGCLDLPDVDMVKEAGVVPLGGCLPRPPPPSSPPSSSLFHGRPPPVEASMVAIVILAAVAIGRPSSSIELVDAAVAATGGRGSGGAVRGSSRGRRRSLCVGSYLHGGSSEMESSLIRIY